MTAVWVLIGVIVLVALEIFAAHRVANKRMRGTPPIITRTPLTFAQWLEATDDPDYDGPRSTDYNAETEQERLDRARELKEGR